LLPSIGSYGEVYRADWNGTVSSSFPPHFIFCILSLAICSRCSVEVIKESDEKPNHGQCTEVFVDLQEVAVKKFLDQDFYGDALDEFRSEVGELLSVSILEFS
jgi:hypothetical protein